MSQRPVRFIASNRLERLADLLAARVAEGLDDPLAGEVIVVQSRGMATWLEQRIAARNGVSFGCRFPFPRHLFFEALKAVDPSAAPDDEFSPERLVWRIHAELTRLSDGPRGADRDAVRGYLENDPAGLRGFQLARRLARLFDDYITYRPQMLAEWESGGEDAHDSDARWQAALWRRLVGDGPARHLGQLGVELFDRLKQSHEPLRGLPARLSVFGVSSLAPFYLHLFDALAHRSEVTFYRLEPCADYWGDIRTLRESVRAEGLAAGENGEERGHRLLGAWGRQGREFQKQVLEFDWDPGDDEQFEEPSGETLLSRLQRGILRIGQDESDTGSVDADDSVQVRICHGPIRELQVLRDHLLRWFSESDLTPRDVLVLTPSIEDYAPLIPAVFGAEPRIPYSVADRSRRSGSPLAGAFLRLLALGGSRLAASDVFALFDIPAIRRRFNLESADVGLVREWLRDAPVWWGLDAESRSELGFGTEAVGTWRRGLDRLLLGYAMEPRTAGLVAGIAPMAGVSGERAVVAGRLAEFLAVLEEHLTSWRTPRTPAGWSVELNRAFDAFFAPDRDEVDEVAVIREALAPPGTAQTDEPAPGVPLAVIAEALRATLETSEGRGGFLSGGVTFCALQPMRSVPARVICVLGLNDDAFPRRPVVAEFDLMARHPKTGDASRGEDDRYLFLETLLSARDRLYLSYSGLSVRDNAESPPSVVVSDLLDSIADTHGDDTAADIVERHRLHPWSVEYFRGGPLRTYSRNAAGAAALLARSREPAASFCNQPLVSETTVEPVRIDLADLKAFLRNPAAFFCERRLGLRLAKPREDLPDRELFLLEGLERYDLRAGLLDHFLDSGRHDDLPVDLWAGTGRLPLGPAGRLALEKEAGVMSALGGSVLAARGPAPAQSAEIAVTLGRFEIRGAIGDLYPAAPIRARAGKIRPRDRLALWADLLVLQASQGADAPRVSGRLFGVEKDRPCSETYVAPADAAAVLLDLLALFAEGASAPVPLIPNASHALAKSFRADPVRARAEAAGEWFGGEMADGECDDPYFAQCFARFGGDPLDERFEAVSLRVFEPLLSAAAGDAEGGKKTSGTGRRGKGKAKE